MNGSFSQEALPCTNGRPQRDATPSSAQSLRSHMNKYREMGPGLQRQRQRPSCPLWFPAHFRCQSIPSIIGETRDRDLPRSQMGPVSCPLCHPGGLQTREEPQPALLPAQPHQSLDSAALWWLLTSGSVCRPLVEPGTSSAGRRLSPGVLTCLPSVQFFLDVTPSIPVRMGKFILCHCMLEICKFFLFYRLSQ